MTPKELKSRLDLRETAKDSFYLLDVRNPNEVDICTIKGTDLLIPVGELSNRFAEIDSWKQSGKDVIVYCRSGGRSAMACEMLKQFGFSKVYNVEGGILLYSDEVDSSIMKY
ncbi:rhodanese-like domain-containing protein [Leptospira noguchii]|uniref:Rhodanese-like protein n=2 Tax=Leptospira noguchii TaxID=28182 RepID=T0FFV0_9LEPT|nr:rhodanese-like domain-containing protein [Leptospira noguchii]EMO53856.1 rhodanese-like protein [Leptospira noguchii]EQA72123.1 rhodanese-like protein [Leptospira noguchii serovar Panama str. CZ214]MCH1912725.1 rhodanese-like domain-containing protein [Leptospira noguchii]MCH1916440.1 rhodanese-like domain-containing protein [Leptospira noguchii]UOG63777.1 rhodanese-like domain-containing protein [Leptospira noguchii]